MKNKFTYSIIVPICNGLEFYNPFFNSLKLAIDNFDFKRLEVLLISNNNKFRSNLIEHINEFKYKSIVKEFNSQEKGSYSARNFGIKESMNQVLIFTDIDCKFNKYYLRNLDDYDFDNKIISGKIKLELSHNSFIDRNSYEFERIFFLNTDKNSQKKLGFTANTIIKKKYAELIPFRNVYSGGDIDFYNEVQDKLGLGFLYAKNLIVYHPSRKFRELKSKILRVVNGLNENNKLKPPLINLLLIIINPFIFKINWTKVNNPIILLLISYYINVIIRVNSIKLFYDLD